MAGYARGALDPRWASHHRPVVRGFMVCEGVLYHKDVPDLPTQRTGWQPTNADPDLRVPAESAGNVAIYQGPARVQPQLGWRARKQNKRVSVVTEQGVGIMLDFRDNQLREDGVQFPVIVPNDFFRVTRVLSWGDVKVDPQLEMQDYFVRTLTPSSNSWVRSLMCDVNPGSVHDSNGSGSRIDG